jgi:DNA-binding LacI/PurR family transcriptional regulator
LFTRSVIPQAVFCGNDILAVGLMDAARREFALDIPRDLSVVGFDDIGMASWPSHALTTVRQPVDAMLDRLVEFVVTPRALDRPKQTRLPGLFITRGTTAAPQRTGKRKAATPISA